MIEEGFRPTRAEINLSVLSENIRWLRACSQSFLCPMIKSNAYGHGDLRVAQVLFNEKVDAVGVALIEEAARLRQQNVHGPILVFGGFGAKGAVKCIELKLTPVVKLWSELEALASAAQKNQPIAIHLKFDTGMSRLGFGFDQTERVFDFLRKTPQLRVEGVCSHLISSYDLYKEGQSYTRLQFDRFDSITKLFGSELQNHLWNSSGFIEAYLAQDANRLRFGARPSIAMFGVRPELLNLSDLPLKPVLSLKTGVISYNWVPVGQTASYGATWEARRPTMIGVVPIGYADGYSRFFSNKGKMLFRGKIVSVVGRVCMDYTLLDLTDVTGSNEGQYGEDVVIIGEQNGVVQSAQDLAEQIGTISYEILTSLGPRVPRKYFVD